jgi:hypothetical protein
MNEAANKQKLALFAPYLVGLWFTNKDAKAFIALASFDIDVPAPAPIYELLGLGFVPNAQDVVTFMATHYKGISNLLFDTNKTDQLRIAKIVKLMAQTKPAKVNNYKYFKEPMALVRQAERENHKAVVRAEYRREKNLQQGGHDWNTCK